MRKLEQLKPERVFYYFEQIANIPHGSYHTKAISDYIANFAKNLNLEYYQEKNDNLVIIKEATTGYENSEPIIIQGHIDMVCEKEPDSTIDFLQDGLDLYVEDGFLKARGTTLGADDGVAVAFAMALLESTNLAHPRLEVILTTNEEVGLIGAKEIDLSMLKGHYLLNIDSDIEGHFLTSCAGGITCEITLNVKRIPNQNHGFLLTLGGLFGGHSGSEIDKERGNAIMLTGRVLSFLANKSEFALSHIEGGLKDNAIPRETKTILTFDESETEPILSALKECEQMLKNELQSTDPGIFISLQPYEQSVDTVLEANSFTKVIFLLRNLPNGVMHMCGHEKNLVETSLNSGIMKMKEDQFFLCTSIRSSVTTRKMEVLDRVTFLSEFLGASLTTHGDYTPWEYRADSILRDKIQEVYQNVSNNTPVFEAIHAGLECGILAPKIKNMDAVSFGPENLDIHTPKERLNIASVERVWNFLINFLASMKE